LITAQYTGNQGQRGFTLRNVLIANGVDFRDEDFADLENDPVQTLETELVSGSPAVPEVAADSAAKLWVPQEKNEAGKWQSQVRLSNEFFEECIKSPVPMDLRAYKALRGSPLAMDVYPRGAC
jgi:hypothetical protein